MSESLTRISVEPGNDGGPARLLIRNGLLAGREISRTPLGAEIALVASAAILLPGDAVRLEIEVGTGCALKLVEVGGLVAYGADPATPPDEVTASYSIDVDLHDAAQLNWDGLPVVVADGADLIRSSTLRLGQQATARLRETVVLGRVGERGGRARLTSDVADATGPILVEDIRLDGAAPVPGVLGGNRVLDSFMRFGPAAESDAFAGSAGLTHLRLERGGEILRWLGQHTHESPLQHN